MFPREWSDVDLRAWSGRWLGSGAFGDLGTDFHFSTRIHHSLLSLL
jgi:hypothetical protein